MDLYRIINELVEERDKLQRIINSLEGISPSTRAAAAPQGKRRGRKSMDGPARQEVSERMKVYWENRRREQAAAKAHAESHHGKAHSTKKTTS